MIIGLTGTLGSGKGTIVNYLVKKGFRHLSVREFLIKEIERRGMPINRDSMVHIANNFRAQNSPSYIVERLYEIAERDEMDCIIESIRTPGEAETLKEKGRFYLIAVDAAPEIRFKRILERGNETDNVTYKRFCEDENREMESEDPNKQNLSKCIEMANFKIRNDGSIEELMQKVDNAYREIKKLVISTEKPKEERPSWDEYFVDIMRAVSKRSTCNRGQVGCVIVKDKHILVTGYAGAPVGLPHCDEVGHQMTTVIHGDGSSSQHCTRTAHAEQNAICQAAKLGVSLNDATVYCKMTPCSTCAKMIINSGIKRVIVEKDYHAGAETKDMFKQAGIELDILDERVETYKDM